MKKMFDVVERVAETEATVLVTGESGTGKELVARALHGERRARAARSWPINCARHARDAARERAVRPREGRVHRRAHGAAGPLREGQRGTLFLDEIGEMPLRMQAKLLRALQERRSAPSAATRTAFDARIVAATQPRSRDRGRGAALPRGPLLPDQRRPHSRSAAPRARERRPAARAALPRAMPGSTEPRASSASRAPPSSASSATRGPATCASCRIASSALSRCRSSITSVSTISPSAFAGSRARLCTSTRATPPHPCRCEQVLRQHVAQVLGSLGGNKALAARQLGVDRRTLYRMLERWSDGGAGGPAVHESRASASRVGLC